MNEETVLLYQMIGAFLSAARKKKGWSLQEVANRLETRKSKTSIQRYETGEAKVDLVTLYQLCEMMGLNMNRLIDLSWHYTDLGIVIDRQSAETTALGDLEAITETWHGQASEAMQYHDKVMRQIYDDTKSYSHDDMKRLLDLFELAFRKASDPQ